MTKQSIKNLPLEKEARALALTPRGNVVLTQEEVDKLQVEHRAIALRAKAMELAGVIPADFDAMESETREQYIDAAADALAEEQGNVPPLGSKPKGDLVRVTKDGVALDVHPDAIESHKDAGWTLVQS